jgi:hypothetical protein
MIQRSELHSFGLSGLENVWPRGLAAEYAREPALAPDRAGITVFRDITFLAAGPASEGCRSAEERMAEASEYLTHPVLGTLGWLPRYSHWFAQHPRPEGGTLDVIVEPGDGDRYEFLPRAAELFQWGMDNERAVLTRAVRAYLLDLYNGGWQQDDLPVLDAEGFTAALEWQLLVVSASDTVPVVFGYDPGELFWGHTVSVEVDAGLQYRGAHLVG